MRTSIATSAPPPRNRAPTPSLPLATGTRHTALSPSHADIPPHRQAMVEDFTVRRGVDPREVWASAPAQARRCSHVLLERQRVSPRLRPPRPRAGLTTSEDAPPRRVF